MGPPAPPPPPPRIAKNSKIFALGPIYEKLVVIFSLVIFVCSVMRYYCPENLVIQYEQHFFFHFFYLNLKVHVNQDGPSLIIEAPPPQAPKWPKMLMFSHM